MFAIWSLIICMLLWKSSYWLSRRCSTCWNLLLMLCWSLQCCLRVMSSSSPLKTGSFSSLDVFMAALEPLPLIMKSKTKWNAKFTMKGGREATLAYHCAPDLDEWFYPLGATGKLTQRTRESLGWRKGWKSGMQIKPNRRKVYCSKWVNAKRNKLRKGRSKITEA